MENKIKLFEDKKVRVAWNEDEQDWYFSVVDIVAVLNESDYQSARLYWKVLKNRLKSEGLHTVLAVYAHREGDGLSLLFLALLKGCRFA